jgi:1-acyl-sn-glycerol-3-phosphate acyltransferase
MDTRARTVERRIAELAGEISGRELAPDEPIGLDSLGHAELALAVEEDFGVWLPDGTASSTVRELSAAVRGRLPVTGRTAPLRPGIGSMNRLGKMVMRPILHGYYRLEVDGAERVPPLGPVILASNHDSFVDIPLLGVAVARPVWFMAKQELFRPGFRGWFFHALGGFPVRRDRNDLGAVRAGIAVLRWGWVLGMYPEGTRSTQLLPFLHGSAWLALVTGAPIVPVRVTGTRESMPPGALWPRRARVRIAFGEALRPDHERDPRVRLERARDLTLELRAAVAGPR